MHLPPLSNGNSQPRVLIVHDFAETFGGAERIVAEIAAAFPGSRLVAITGRPEVAARMGMAGRFRTLLGSSPPLLRHYRKLVALYPALASLRRLPAADLLISSSYAFAHGFSTVNGAPHLSYCYSPLRFAWTMGADYGAALAGPRAAGALDRFAAPFRVADRRASGRVDRYVAESSYVAGQIREFYGRVSTVIYPPVDCCKFRPSAASPEDYALLCGRLIEPYKRPTMVVEAFRRMPERRLVVAGDGPEAERLRRIAPANVEFRGALADDELVEAMARCSFAVFPSRDDFGLVPVEVMACGRPVLAFAGGGALETIPIGVGGELFAEQSVDCLVEAISRFEPERYRPAEIRAHAERFDAPRFRESIRAEAQRLLGD
ncbi:MAG: glycosyltransferase [Solirubrobacterales bacterium]